ncbi:class A beta-lactamase [uncultured Sphingomonas sp.]|uniref:class A beta-lactamase n=1 Tax=uncultured Sphingomonas sp. TaxID=158754 RepID=UPI00260866EC|nr:class A beta-lactamase [uncultured Sphingomonas sp.]
MSDAFRIVRRRTLLTAMIVAPLARPGRAVAAEHNLADLAAGLERQVGGHLGVAHFVPRTGALRGHRLDQRFPMCSTFKLLACAGMLARVDKGRDHLDARVAIREADLMEHAPVTGRHVGGTMTVADLCAAAVRESDNVAANLLLRRLGGPGGVTGAARSLGDRVTRLDRWEPDLNTALPGDPRDTTTPAAMARLAGRILEGDALLARSRMVLRRWMVETRTGLTRIRAGLPDSWTAGDKTGSGANGTTNDVAWIRPPGGDPAIVAIFLTGTPANADARDAVFSTIAQHVAAGR